jgi:hypothetical protein
LRLQKTNGSLPLPFSVYVNILKRQHIYKYIVAGGDGRREEKKSAASRMKESGKSRLVMFSLQCTLAE